MCESDGDFVEGGAVDIGEEVPDVSVRIAVAESPSVKVKVIGGVIGGIEIEVGAS